MGRWEWSAFTDGSIYVDAVSQIFFSLSLAQGVMQGYASNNPQGLFQIVTVIIVLDIDKNSAGHFNNGNGTLATTIIIIIIIIRREMDA